MTLHELMTDLRRVPATMALAFTYDDQRIGSGYHVTELKQTSITGIDCGGMIDRWEETHLQLLDGTGRDYMTVGKFIAIAERSLRALPQLGAGELLIDFALGNEGLHILEPTVPSVEGDLVALHLHPTQATCKAAERRRRPGRSVCCGSMQTDSACCA